MNARPQVHETVGGAVAKVASRLRAAGIASPGLDARLLAARALDLSAEQVIMTGREPVGEARLARLEALVVRRLAREPMAQILGTREFWSRSFRVTRDILTPRPESEEIIAAVLDRVPDRTQSLRILDLGVGSACLLGTLLHEYPHATGVGVDRSGPALAVARANLAAHGLAGRAELIQGDWATAIFDEFNVIVTNPPYIRSEDLDGLEPEVRRYEPRGALDGGPDGQDAYRVLLPAMPRLMAPGAVAALELGAGQADAIAAMARLAGLVEVNRRCDLAGHERCLVLALPGQK